ncbi:MAG: peptidoglycan editing factor PgeF [Actinomycetales bacterium]
MRSQQQGRTAEEAEAPLLALRRTWPGEGEDGRSAGVAVTWRHGGVSEEPYRSLNLGDHVGDAAADVLTNRDLLAATLGLAPSRLVFMQQVHGREVAVVDDALLRRLAEEGEPGVPVNAVAAVDALVTDRPGVGLAVLVADCVPVLLADPAAGVIGAAHAGRRGVEAGVLEATVSQMRALGARDVRALVGPAICGQCYEVPAAMQEQVAAAVPPAARAGVAVASRKGTAGLDLPAAVRAQLAELAVAPVEGLADGSSPCTAESPDFYSYRRDGVTGRFAGVVWLGQ